ncbi:MAG: xanthine dehydrogenase family protein subunit M [Alphaproteobacteria bacterium]|jgi:carbon-monoxide dehydrogenase medium subunit|nr:molybdopterin dehydrogenase [Rhodospirillaceae bacterium]MDP6023754.1 xanthine dehydrogenase family protein subunit M [Alphaproteobacteria bacterium]MDP6255278.1 xanthine dehydrogenase family protein subunit M [Alphaproteobacteria bacterium]MDP7052846.1 xanthine dehydrogenase family protein subunit M [Alphaproteobacteria bacterium]MDP7229116.1 xanthine dehydrogenase family protein subunit M [Alphaproteobacteria bacterium]|tara:strand:- start:1100 stop:1942 length:843 start_codon:yes stop_codon:yes gene_type:complete
MKAPNFEYRRPESLTEALELLAQHGDDATIIAGGQSLLALLNFRMAAPELLVDIGRLEELKQITGGADHVEIGGLVRHCDLAASPLIAQTLPLLPQAIGHIAHPAVRHRGTIGGSLAMADPAAELAACCLALDATFSLVSARGQRWVGVGDFFQGVYETALESDEVLTAIRLPKPAPDSVGIFKEVARRQGDFAMAGLAFVTAADSGPRIALLGVADRPMLARRTMAFLKDSPLNEARAKEAVDLIGTEVDPPEDPTYPPAYRRHLVQVLLQRVLMELIQ